MTSPSDCSLMTSCNGRTQFVSCEGFFEAPPGDEFGLKSINNKKLAFNRSPKAVAHGLVGRC